MLPGVPEPLGAVPDQDGTNFAVVSPGDAVTLCLFDDAGAETRLVLPERDGDVRHGYVPGVGAGQAYGYRVAGPFDPARGMRFDPSKLLLDPYARAIDGEVRFAPAVFTGAPADSAPFVPRSVVVAPAAQAPARRRTPLADAVFYEVHVKGFTMSHPDVPPELRGTYAGLAHPAAVAHLVDLGVTTVELLPVHHNVPEPFLVQRGLTNYWGYNTIGFFAPHAGYAARQGGQVEEFRAMVAALHDAGLDVVLDVVFNHTAEAGADGPVLCHRGLWDGAYYHLDPSGGYVDTTGTGNALNAGHPVALRMVMDALRYWITVMGVDGFRFDLAPTLARENAAFDTTSPFFDLVAQDPVVSRTLLVAEPWDVGRMDSYDVGRFPAGWRVERPLHCARLLAQPRRDPASRLPDGLGRPVRATTGSSAQRTVHAATGRERGPTDDQAVLALRACQRRAMLATLLLSAGVPLLLGGDEIGRTQRGNNNAYCQDNALTWFNWAGADQELLAFTRDLIRLRRAHPALRRRRFLTGAAAADLRWFTPAGTAMTDADWADRGARAIAMFVDGQADPDVAPDGTPLVDDDLLVLVNAWWEDR